MSRWEAGQDGKQVKMTLPTMDFMRLMQGVIIERMVDGQAGGPPIIEQQILAQKKSINKF